MGTGAVILVELHAEGVAAVPLNFTVLLPCDDRKLVPVITMEEPIAPVLGARLVTVGAPLPRGRVIWESKLPFRVPSRSASPLKVVADVPVRFTPTQR